MRRVLLVLLGLLLGLFILKFMQENAEPVVLDFWVVRSQELSLGLAVLAAALAGGLCTFLFLGSAWLGQARRERRLKRRVRELEEEVARTRNLPITEPRLPPLEASDRDRAEPADEAGGTGEGSGNGGEPT